MSIEVVVPALPESVSDATVLTWHKKEGETVQRDENLVELETDKVVLEVPAPVSGVLATIAKKEGSQVTAHEVLALLEKGASAPLVTPTAAPSTKKSSTGDAFMSPAVRRMALEHGIRAEDIQGSGKGGRILKEDILDHVSRKENVNTSVPKTEQPILAPAQTERPEQRVPMTRLRARVAERLTQAQQNAAILTTFNEVDLQQIIALRSKYKEIFEKQHGVKLGFMSFFVTAAVEALKRFPIVNASVDQQDIIYHGYFDIGIAVSAPRGLVVPILKDADQLSLADIEKGIRILGSKAKEGKLTMDDLTGGTFSISNGGVFGSMLSTPILNPPQSAILGMHTIQQRPVARDGEVVIRPMMYLALSYDHRIIDGSDAVRFLVAIKDMLEDPGRILLAL